jgi:Mg2+ and Co2+ transporter CorA
MPIGRRGQDIGKVMGNEFASIGYVHLIAAIICSKWSMDLGYSQSRQLLWATAGLVAAPLILLILYVRMIRKSLN